MHDRCPIHTARVVQEWFEAQNNIQLLEWPSKGADINVIEHIWAQMVNTWKMEHERTSYELMDHVKAQ